MTNVESQMQNLTVSFADKARKKSCGKNSVKNCKKSELKASEVNFERAISLLPDKSSGILFAHMIDSCQQYQCSKCLKLFLISNTAAEHYSSCQENVVICDEISVKIIFCCTVCFEVCNDISYLVAHKKVCANQPKIGRRALPSYNGETQTICLVCGFYHKCPVSFFFMHECAQMEKRMKSASVNIKKLPQKIINQKKACSIWACKVCPEIFVRTKDWQYHKKRHPYRRYGPSNVDNLLFNPF